MIDSRESRFRDTRRAFDGVAADYDGPTGNNAIIQLWRAHTHASILAVAKPGARLLDLGCGTGLDLAYFAARGFRAHGIDWSPAMVARARARLAAAGLADRATAEVLGIHQIEQIRGERFDLIYTNFGPLN